MPCPSPSAPAFRLGCVAALLSLTASSPTVHAAPQSKTRFANGQPPVHRLIGWGSRAIAMTGPGAGQPEPQVILLDLEKAEASALTLPRVERVVDIAEAGLPMLLVRTGGKLGVLTGTREGWVKKAIPKKAEALGATHLAADGPDLLLLADDQYFWLKDGRWNRRSIQEARRFAQEIESGHISLALVDTKLVLGLDRAELGGGLLVLDLPSGTWRGWAPRRTGLDFNRIPVTDLGVDPAGKVWASQGLSRSSLRQGALWGREGQDWQLIASTDSFRDESYAWPLDHAGLSAVAFDGVGRVHALSSELGVTVFDGRAWRTRTPGWPSPLPGHALRIHADRIAVIGTSESGVLLWELDSPNARQIQVKLRGNPRAR